MESKNALDKVIKKSRVHFYKPIQIAEILHEDRQNSLDLKELSSYRNASRKWRDVVTMQLVGRISTSSARYQDDVFNENAMPPRLLVELGELNKTTGGAVEAYIYQSMKSKLDTINDAANYIKSSTPETFRLQKLLEFFQVNPGLRRSIDKMYEITVYALFSTIVKALKAEITIEVQNKDEEVLADFESFIELVLGLTKDNKKVTKPASLFRAGVTNAADRGLDMISNFGPVIQVKHLTLKPEDVEVIAGGIAADSILIVCVDAEKDAILALMTQLGMESRIQGIITLSDLESWYSTCFGEKYRSTLGYSLIADLNREFENEFPSGKNLDPFLKERGYDSISLPDGWNPQEE